MKRRSAFRLSALLVALLVTITGCGNSNQASTTPSGNEQAASNESATNNAGETIKIGAIYPLSGPLALLGQESFRGVEVAVDKWNKAGGIQGKKIELIPVDTPSSNDAIASAQRLVTKDKVHLVVGSFESSIASVASQITERSKVPYFELGSVADDITEQGFQYLFRTNPPSYMYAESDIKFIKHLAAQLNRPVESLKIAFIHEDSNWGTSIADDFEKLAKAENMQVVKRVSYNMGTVTSLDSEILSLKEANPDVVIGVSYINDSILVKRTMDKLGFNPTAFIGQGGGFSLPNFKEALGPIVNGVYNIDFTQYAGNPDTTPGQDEYVKLYTEKYGNAPLSGHSLTNYFGAETTFAILKQANSLDPDKIREAAMSYEAKEGTTSTGWGVKFDEKGQNTLCLPFAMQYQDQKQVTVWPENQASAKIQLK